MEENKPVIDLELIYKASPKGWPHWPMWSGTSSDSNTGGFFIGYMTAIAFRLGYTPEQLRALHLQWHKDHKPHRLTWKENTERMHKWLEEQLAKLPSS